LTVCTCGTHGFTHKHSTAIQVIAQVLIWFEKFLTRCYRPLKCYLQSLACALLVTQATKVAVGTLRPDFLARCAPIIQPPDNFTIQYGQITTAEYPCTGNADDIKEGRQSFPSGHSAFSFNLAAYASSYLLWCWNMRRAWVPKNLKPWQEFLSDLGNVVAKLWLLIMLGVAW
jgi:membrane-associated phospholipid phosphatase